jgi:hypothetical protein
MAARWDIAAVVVALMAMFVSVSPTAISFLEITMRSLNSLIWPARGRCRRFVWDDVQVGLLHICDPRGCSHVNDWATKLHSIPSCWDQTLGQVFNRAWYFMNADSNSTKYVTKKPHQLALSEEYIQTDIQTLKAFLLLTTGVCRTLRDCGCDYFTGNTAFSWSDIYPSPYIRSDADQHAIYQIRNRSNYWGIPSILSGTLYDYWRHHSPFSDDKDRPYTARSVGAKCWDDNNYWSDTVPV